MPVLTQRLPRRFPGTLTDVLGIQVGHHTRSDRPTGCTLVLCTGGAVAGVDVRGAAPGTRETALLDPTHLVDRIHGVLLTGGSAWGLDATAGAVRWLEEQAFGYPIGPGKLPLVPAAVLFDLHVGDYRIRPSPEDAYEAARTASARPVSQGCVGAGAGASLGKVFGMGRAMKGGIGSASLRVEGVTVAALVAVNALGDVIDPRTAQVLAGARRANGRGLLDTRRALIAGELPQTILAGTNTTIGVIATDALVNKAEATRLALMGHDGLARSINPVHTMQDGDTLFALGTGASGRRMNMMALGTLAAEVTARAVVNAALAAKGLRGAFGVDLPAARDLWAS